MPPCKREVAELTAYTESIDVIDSNLFVTYYLTFKLHNDTKISTSAVFCVLYDRKTHYDT